MYENRLFFYYNSNIIVYIIYVNIIYYYVANLAEYIGHYNIITNWCRNNARVIVSHIIYNYNQRFGWKKIF